MGCKFVCDNCFLEERGQAVNQYFSKPAAWFQKGERDSILIVCSKECAAKLNDKHQEYVPVIEDLL
jgi:hypothetical protein